MSTFETLAQQNPSVRQQYDEWREQSVTNGEDPTDWDAFRNHLAALGAPDPGHVPPDDFVGEEWRAENPDWVARYAGRQTDS